MTATLDCDFVHKADLTKTATMNYIQKLKTQKRSYAYVMVIISTHGHQGDIIMSSDCQAMHLYEDIIAPLNNNRCPIFAGVPKIFVVNACRGDEMLPLTKGMLRDEEENQPHTDGSEYRLDAEEVFLLGESTPATGLHRPVGDIYKILSTTPDSVSLRYGDKGSPLLITLSETLDDLSRHGHINFLEWMEKIQIKMQVEYDILIESDDILDKIKEKAFCLTTKQICSGMYSN